MIGFQKFYFFQYQINQTMGGQDSKPKDDFFFLEHISKMTLTNRKTVSYYLIHPHRDASIEELLKNLRTYFKVDYFPQIKTLKQEMAFVNKHEIVKVIGSSDLSQADVQYLQHEDKIYQVILFGQQKSTFNFPKIVKKVENSKDLVPTLIQLEQKDSLTLPASNLLLVDSDTKILNKYRLNYQCNTHYNGRKQAKEDFITLARQLFPGEAQQIDKFQQEYNLQLEGEEKRKLVLEWGLKNNFYWQMVSQITRNTKDPKRLAYIRLALKDLYDAIFAEFKEKKVYQDIYIVVDITEQEKQKLQNSKGHFILFTSFVKGYTNEKQANAQLKQRPNAFKFTVMPNRGQLEPNLDFGYYVGKGNEPCVIYNIYNVFRIDEVNIKTRRGDILYGVLPEIYIKRQIQSKRQQMKALEVDLMRNFDYLEDILSKVDSQATLLQLFGYHDESLEIYDRKIDAVRQTNDSDKIDRCIIRKADALRISGHFDSAEKQYQTVSKSEKMKVISQIHLAQLYLQIGEQTKFNQTVSKFANRVQSLKNSDKQEYFKAYNLIAIRALNLGVKDDIKKTEKMLDDLLPKITQAYSFSMEGKPIVHDIYRTQATCHLKLSKHTEALGLLKTTLALQMACEGKTANVALTETLIQTVCRSSKQSNEPDKDNEIKNTLKASQDRLKSIQAEIESTQRRLASVSGQNLKESAIKISLSA